MSGIGLHTKTAALALIILTAWGASTLSGRERRAQVESGITIGVEHEAPATLAITRSKGGTLQITDIGNESDETLFVSLPEDWERDEVRGVPLADVHADDPSFGYRRWTVPAGGTVTFHAPRDWPQLTVHNPSGILLQLRMTVIDLMRGTRGTDVYLIKDKPLELRF